MSKNPNQDNKQLRAIGHKLKPVVTIAGKGLNEPVLSEVDRALNDHELIKDELAEGGREAREAISLELSSQTGAKVVQSVGNIILVLRRTAKPDPRLSNLIRRV